MMVKKINNYLYLKGLRSIGMTGFEPATKDKILIFGRNRYVIGFCHTRKDFRYFKIDRIRELKLQKETFIKDPNFDAKTYMEQMFQSEIGDKLFKVKIWFDAVTAPYIREKRWHSSQEITEHDDGSLTLHLSTSGLNDLKRWVLGYGKGAKVLEPFELVNLINSEIKDMSRHYKLSL